MRPLFRITADGEDVTAQVSARLVDLVVQDEAGYEADTLMLTLDDRDARLIVPPHQSLLRVELGMDGAVPVPLTPMGAFRVDETELTGPLRRLRISATAADMSGDIRSPRTRGWEGITLSDMIEKVAGEAGLEAVVAPGLAGVALAYVAQTAESNIHLLTRIARRAGAVVKAADGRLVLARRGAAENAAGTRLDAIALLPRHDTDWSWRSADRGRYASAEASWTELGTASLNKVVVGEGEPRRVLRHVHATEDEARRAARAVLEDASRGAETLRLGLAGFWPQAFAGARVTYADRRPELGGAWVVKTATHTLSDTLKTELSLERPAADEEADP